MSDLCKRCRRQTPTQGDYCKACRETARDRNRRLVAEGKCPGCSLPNPSERWLCDVCSDKQKVCNRDRTRRLKLEAYEAYGGARCVCCGEATVEFLTLDHIEGGGKAHRQAAGRGGGRFYLWLKQNGYPPRLQVMCFNCNCAKGFFGACPHAREGET